MVSDLIDSFASSYKYHRYGPVTVAVGGKAAGRGEIANSPFAFSASIQDMKGMETMALPEGYRTKDNIRVYTATELKIATPEKQILGDRIEYQGFMYEVWKAENWQATDLPYFKYIAAKVEGGF